MQRSALSQLWPRTEAAIYYETKRLAEEGLATATPERSGGRTRTVYRITTRGEDALRAWLREPSDAIRFESEAGVKAFLTAADDVDALQSQLAGLVETEAQLLDDLRAACERWSTGDLAFPERLHHTAMAADLLRRLHATTADWAQTWLEHVSEWDDVGLDQHKASLAHAVLQSIASAAHP